MSKAITKMFLDSFSEDSVADERNSANKKIGKGIKKKGKKKYAKETTLPTRNIKNLLQKCKKEHELDKTEESLMFLAKTSSSKKISGEVTDLVLTQNRGRLSKNNPRPEVSKEEKTVFTDRDFEKFEEEYDFFT